VAGRRFYPLLPEYVRIFEGQGATFKVKDIAKEKFDEFAMNMVFELQKADDPISKICEKYIDTGSKDHLPFLKQVLVCMYQIGLVGIKIQSNFARQWSYIDDAQLSETQIKADSIIDVHKTFWAALGITTKGRKKAWEEVA